MAVANKFFWTLWLTFLVGLNFVVLSNMQEAKGTRDLVPPPPNIENYSAGFKYQLADLFWIRSIQDFDYCESEIARRTCKGKSWLFQLLDSATRLDPKYFPVYSYGGLALTIIISDYPGASVIFDRGVHNFPTDWQLLYRAAYHALYEEKDFDKASDLYLKAGQLGGPEWLPNLASRLRNAPARVELAKRMLEDMERRQDDPIFIEAMERKVLELESAASGTKTSK